MSADETLTAKLRAVVKELEASLRIRLEDLEDLGREWRKQHREALNGNRTAASWEEWSSDRITQAAVAWVLVTVFIRFLEDNRLVKPVWISGPRERRAEALDAQAAFLREQARTNPDVTDREWLENAIAYLARLPATRELVDESSALWLVTPSGDAAGRLLAFWRERDESGELVRDLTDDTFDTRFLGDLYQNLSDEAKARYALLQTPEFVEEFILDRTLEPALTERPLEDFRLIDPTCGSGHFLLGAFARLLERWHRQAPGMDARARAQKALDSIHGVDLNPYAVAISRFRLTIAAMQASGDRLLEDAPAFAYHLAVGDSLLHGFDQPELDLGAEYSADRTAATYTYPTENLAALRTILENRRYDVVVGNPPYITVKDKALNATYRKLYHYCKGTYALTVPFTEKLFDLAKAGERAGWVGQITSNSFMKRGFGAPLVEDFLPSKDLRLVIDSEGAWIPGHNADGTPTVIIVGTNRRPQTTSVRAVLSKGLREGRSHGNGGTGPYWTSIVEHIDEQLFNNEWVSVTDLDRDYLATHPWSLTGGSASDLRRAVKQAASQLLGSRIEKPIGRSIRTGADEAFVRPRRLASMGNLPETDMRPIIVGDEVRDWQCGSSKAIWYPYKYGTGQSFDGGISRELWPLRNMLASRSTFQGLMADAGLEWWEYMQHTASAYSTPLSITFAFVASHNHFALDRGGKVFNRSAPVIKLPEGATEDDHLSLLGVLNSSVACFWLREKSQPKGGATDLLWSRTYEFTGATLETFPLPESLSLEQGRTLERLATLLRGMTPQTVCEGQTPPTREAFDAAQQAYFAIRAKMIAQQEELDWDVYRRYGLIDEEVTYDKGDMPGLTLGERAFEIMLARSSNARAEDYAWLTREGSRRTPETPEHWPPAYREVVERRIALIDSHPYLRLLERPEYKRPWAQKQWSEEEDLALRSWLLDRLEDHRFWFDRAGRPTPRSIAQLADEVARKTNLTQVLALWVGRPDVPVETSLQRLLADEAVPYLAAYRYKESGLLTRAAWEYTWALQRREDVGERFGPDTKNGPIPIPPKYKAADFARPEYWAKRKELDLPRERFILYPDAHRATDPTPVLGWAGWDHAQKALALDQLVQRGEVDGWEDERLRPLVAGLAELLPWVKQWHAGPDPFYGGISPAEFFGQQLDDRARQVERTVEQLADWRPAPTRRGRARKAAAV